MSDNLIGHGLIDYVFVLFMMAYAYYAGQTKPQRILYILPACLSCFFFIPFGSMLTADKLVPAIFITSIILSKGANYFALPKKNTNNWISKLWILIIFSGIIGLIYNSYYSNYISSPFIKTRLLIQLISYTNFILIFIIVRKECSKLKGTKILLQSFLITTTILCIYGIYQYFAHQLGLPFRGLVRSAYTTGLAEFYDGTTSIFRVNSFASEPKRLTYFLVLGLIILFKYKSLIIKKVNIIYYFIIVSIHILVLWLTYSTSIYISIGIFVIFLLFYVSLVNYNKALFQQLALFICIGGSVYLYQKNYLTKLYEVRVDKQLDREEVRAEVKGQEFVLNNPNMFILGLGPGIYNFALSKEFPKSAGLSEKGTVLIPFNSGLLTYLFDFGIIGFLLLLWPIFQILFNKQISAKNDYSIFVVFLYCTAITLNPTATLFFFIGALEGHKNLVYEN